MKNLLEKLKSLDKKVYIIAGVAVVVVIGIIIALVIGLGSNSDGADPQDTETTIETKKGDKETDAESETEEETEAESETEEETEESTETAEETDAETAPETSAYTNPETSAPIQQTPDSAVEQQPVATNPNGDDILGEGSASHPYLEIPVIEGNSMAVITNSVPAGKSLYYSIYRVGGMILTINNANVYVVCDGVRYDAQGGVLSMTVPAALASDSITFEIGNKGGAAASFKLVFTNPVGTQSNPVVVYSVGNTNSVSLAEGDSDGYTYKYVAEKTGTMRFYMSSSVTSVISVTNNSNSAQRTSDSDAQTDAQGTYIEIDVTAGDALTIVVGAKPNQRGKYPAATINWSGKYN